MPVTTPSAKLMRKSFPKKRVSRSQRSSPVRYQAVCIPTRNQTSPIVTGTNRKWYSVVTANCQRARSSASMPREAANFAGG